MTECKFSVDNLDFFIECFPINKSSFTQLCDWIQAPKNLQQFIAVAENLNELLSVNLHSELAAELGLDKLPVNEWQALLQQIKPNFSGASLELIEIKPNKQVRPAGLIGSYPVYATLTAAEVDYPTEEIEKIRVIHLIGMSAAIAYQQMLTIGVIKELSSGFEAGLREIRDLEKTAKRPAVPLPDWRDAVSLTEVQAELEEWIERHSITTRWGAGLRLLIESVAEQRSRASRHYRMRISTQTQRSGQKISLQESDFTDESSKQMPSFETTMRVPDNRSKKSLQQQGLHPAEMATLATVIVTDPTAPRSVQSDERLIRHRNRRRVQASIVQSAQSLPNRVEMPTPYEVQALLHCLANDFIKKNLPNLNSDQHDEIKVSILLRLYTGRKLDSLRKLLVFQNKVDYEAAQRAFFAVLIDESCLAFPVKSTANPHSLGAVGGVLLANEPFYHNDIQLQDVLDFRLPPVATQAVIDLATRKLQCAISRKRVPLFEYADDHEQWIRELLKKINQTYATRWTEHRLGLVMRMAVEQCTQDPALVQLITEQEYSHSVVANYYQRTSVALISEVVEAAHKLIQQWVRTGLINKPAFSETARKLQGEISIGSSLALPTNFVAELCKHLKHHARLSPRRFTGDERLRHAHNSLVAYITVWLGFISGYRAVLDPISDPRHLDRETGLMVISDKDNSLFQHSRIIPLTERFVAQIDRYAEHLTQLAMSLPHKSGMQAEIYQLCHRYQGTDISTHELSIPFLFFLTDTLQARAVSPKNLQEHFPFEIRANANRHYLRSSLVELGAPGEMVSYFMGHWEHGEEPHQKLSSISPIDIAIQLAPYLNTIEKQIGWTVQGGLAHV
ncbi:hypothetical protein P6F15_04765 [Thiopseudomonas alkaliphila]|uniref:hypothetical protein n=1 Tax=Thiopseudomonas alkaliphila TaxID=1697053 RepID=UPI003570F9E8